jgi:hypothetical protein
VRVEIVDCKRSGTYVECQMRGVNRTGHDLSFLTANGDPTFAVEERVDGQWQKQWDIVCGTGLGYESLPSEGSFEKSVLVRTSAPMFRVGLGFDGEGESSDDIVWSEPIQTPAPSQPRR